MKRTANFLRPTIFLLLLAWSAAAQVINFDVPGGAGAANYSGQGAYSDPGKNYWNPIIGGGTTGATNRLSDGVTHSPITLQSDFGGTYGSQGAQGTAAGLLLPYQYNSGAWRVDTLNNVPSGTYSLYLYGVNNTGTRGTIYTVSTTLMPPTRLATVNTPASLTSFAAGANYVVFTNVVVGADGAITFAWVGNPDVTLAGNNEGDLNAVQLAHVSNNTAPLVSNVPNFGPWVLLFDPSMTEAAIQNMVYGVFANQQNSEFGLQRYAFLFQPGAYTNLDLPVGYYTELFGLGQAPENVTITGNVHSDGALANHNADTTFWRACLNLAVVPTNSNTTMTWAVSQGASLRRMRIKGNLNLANTDNGAWSSGGFLADSRIDGTVSSVTQQQWLSRNDLWGNWSGQSWNMVFVGISNPPAGTWPASPFTVVTNTPYIAEKPYFCLDASSNITVRVPALATNGTSGTSWNNGVAPGVSLPMSQFYFARPGIDNAASINAALASGLNLIVMPGIYYLTNSLLVTRADTVVLGMGFPTLIPTQAFPTMILSDVDGIKVAGLIFDAGPSGPPELLEIGTAASALDHSADPICLYDICSRVGGQFPGTTVNCVAINANNVLGDNIWLWRADHGNGVGWTQNVSRSGLVVNGNNVTIYGLFVEHHENFQTVWNGNGGRVYFYQSELPYDPASQNAWSHNGTNGYASYKVADSVTSHAAYGLGVYAVFKTSNAKCFNAIETPANAPQVNLHDMTTVFIEGDTGSEITHIINGTGATVNTPIAIATANSLWPNPSFSAGAAMAGSNFVLSFPTESWHAYQIQQKSAAAASTWQNFGAPVNGNDAVRASVIPILSATRVYRVISY